MNEELRSLGRSFGIYITLVTLSFGSASGQNLIHNPSFELLSTTCEEEQLSVNYFDLVDWLGVGCTQGPTYCSACNNELYATYYGVPNNSFGSQEAFDGAAYLTVVGYQGPPYPSDYYPCIRFDTLLEANVEYCLTMYMNLAGISAYKNQSYSALFYGSHPSACNGLDTIVWRDLAQINFDITAVDSTNWTELSGSFIANGNEEYLVMGNLTVDHADTVFIGPSPANYQWAVYFLDMVSLVRCDEVGISETTTQDIHLFPNPAHHQFTITVPDSFIGCSVEISTALGQNLQREQVLSTSQQFNLAIATPGVYFLRLVKNDLILNRSFVVE